MITEFECCLLFFVRTVSLYEVYLMFSREILPPYPSVITRSPSLYSTPSGLYSFVRDESNTNLAVHQVHEKVHPVNHLDLEQYITSYAVSDTLGLVPIHVVFRYVHRKTPICITLNHINVLAFDYWIEYSLFSHSETLMNCTVYLKSSVLLQTLNTRLPFSPTQTTRE